MTLTELGFVLDYYLTCPLTSKPVANEWFFGFPEPKKMECHLGGDCHPGKGAKPNNLIFSLKIIWTLRGTDRSPTKVVLKMSSLN